MRLALLATALLLAGCLGAASEPVAPPALGRIDGAVVDQVLRPFAHLNVTLLNLDRVDDTSELGGFTFRDVPPGTYTLVAQAPGTQGDVKVIQVQANKITRVILQLLPIPSKVPFVTSLKNRAQEDLGLPGQPCKNCEWGTFLLKRPDEVVARAAWDGLPAGSSRITLSLVDDKDRPIASATGTSPLELDVPGDQVLADAARLKLQVTFADDFTPQPFDVETFLDLYYNAPRAAQT